MKNGEKFRPPNTQTQEEFIKKCIEKHGDRFDYSEIGYKTLRDKITVICPEHGKYQQFACNHLSGNGGCKQCNKSIGRHPPLTQETFLAKAIEKHKDIYSYDKLQYIGCSTLATFSCHTHGDFEKE